MLGVTLQWTSIPSWGEQKFSYFKETREREGHTSAKRAKAYSYIPSVIPGHFPVRSAKEPLRGAKILFYGCGLKCLYPPKSYQFLSYIFFGSITLKHTAKAPAVGILRLNKLRGTNPHFQPQTVTTNIPALFIWETPIVSNCIPKNNYCNQYFVSTF